MTTATPVDLSDSALWRNGFPDELFAELRRGSPIFHHELTEGVAKTVRHDFWITSKHRHSQRIHRDTDSFTAVDGPLIQGVGPVGSFPTIINMDPQDLNKRRRVMSHAFTPRAIGKLEEGIRACAASLIDRLLAAGGGDWIADVADVLPMSVIGDIIGMPDEDKPEIFDTLDRILKVNSTETPLTQEEQLALFGRIFSYAIELTAEKRRNPQDDIWSTLTSAVITDENGEQLSIPANELEIFFFILAFAGSDTTKNALAAGLQAFAERGQRVRRRRPGPERGQVHDPDTREGQFARWRRVRGLSLLPKGVVVRVADTGGLSHRSRRRDRHQPRSSRLAESGGIVNVYATLTHVIHVRDR
jgi:cytochrome P450